jgi:hypothetical protein
MTTSTCITQRNWTNKTGIKQTTGLCASPHSHELCTTFSILWIIHRTSTTIASLCKATTFTLLDLSRWCTSSSWGRWIPMSRRNCRGITTSITTGKTLRILVTTALKIGIKECKSITKRGRRVLRVVWSASTCLICNHLISNIDDIQNTQTNNIA